MNNTPFASGTSVVYQASSGDLPATLLFIEGEKSGERYYCADIHIDGFGVSHGIEESRLITDPAKVAKIFAEIAPPVKPLQPTSTKQCTSAQPAKAKQSFELDFLLHNATLNKQIENLHREGHYLRGACPKCKLGRDRFYAGPKNNYTVFRCQQCGHYEFTNNLLGLGWTVTPAPAVKEYRPKATASIGQVLAVRDIYNSFTDFAQAQLSGSHAIEALAKRGLNWDADHRMLAFIQKIGLGYINTKLYRQWFNGLSSEKKTVAVHWAGLPDGDQGRLDGHAAMFAGGYQGKIVFAYYNQSGEVVDVRTRSISPKDTIGGKPVRYTSPKGSANSRGVDVPYGVERLDHAPRIVLTEGEFKSLVPMAHGSIPVIGLRGTGDFIPDYLPYFRNRLVILAFDNDDRKQPNGLTAGQIATVRHGRILEANDIDVMVLNPAKLGATKGIDDFVFKWGINLLNLLLQPSELVTLAEFEAELVRSGADLSKFVNPKADSGTVRQWTPVDLVDTFPHAEQPTVTLDETVTQIAEAATGHLTRYKRGNNQLLITAPAGVGKTQTTIQEARRIAQENGQTVAVILPNHDGVDEKIGDGTLEGFQHIYGRRWDDDDDPDGIQNCEQADVARALTIKGYSPAQLLCPTCPALAWCEKSGYRAQFRGKANRAYVHAHAHTEYPGLEDIVILDEFGHKQFVDDIQIWPNDIVTALQKAALNTPQRLLLEGMVKLFSAPDLEDLDSATFYEVLERFASGLRNVDAWGDGSLVQLALDMLAGQMLSTPAELPYQFGDKLFAVLAEDVRRLNNGQMPTGRIRLVVMPKGKRCIAVTYNKGPLPKWYNTRPVIVLNATADADIMQDLLGPVKVLAPQVAIAAGNEIIQDITYNNAKSSYVGNSENALKRRAAWFDNIRHHITQHPKGEADTVLICAKAIEDEIKRAFPLAKVAHYHALEGRNDLQAGLTILVNMPPINLEAIKREASALWPGIDTTLTRTRIAFAESNASGEALAVEQIDGVDPRLQKLIWQHRDAAVIQAVHRSRIIRQTGRKVVVMFSRPIPGLKPTQIIKDYKAPSTKALERKQETLRRLVDAGQALLAELGGFTVATLGIAANVSVNTARKYFTEVIDAVAANAVQIPLVQSMKDGGRVRFSVNAALSDSMYKNYKLPADHDRYQLDLISIVISRQPTVNASAFAIDLATLCSLIGAAPPPPAPPPPPPPEPANQPQSAADHWKRFLGDLDAWRYELELARKSSDPMRRHAGAKLYGYLSGTPIDKQAFISATQELNPALLFKVDWRALQAATYPPKTS